MMIVMAIPARTRDKQMDNGSVGVENDLVNQEANESVISNRFMSLDIILIQSFPMFQQIKYQK